MTCYIPRWFTRPQTVTHPSTYRARCRLTSLIEPTTLTNTPRRRQEDPIPPVERLLRPGTEQTLHGDKLHVEVDRSSVDRSSMPVRALVVEERHNHASDDSDDEEDLQLLKDCILCNFANRTIH